MATTPEGRIKKALDKMFKEEGTWYYSPQAGPFGAAGIPDRIAVVKGLIIGVECKADGTKKPTALQTRAMEQIEKAGGKCFLAYDSDTIETVREFIRACNREIKGVSLKT